MTDRTRTKPGGSDDREADIGILADLIGYHLRRAQARVFSDFAMTMADDPMTPGKFGVLAVIETNPGLSQSSLARTLGVERSTMVEVIDQLEKQGLVARRQAPRDRRSYALTLTDTGRARFAELEPMVRDHEHRISANLDDSEVRTLINLLRRIGVS